MANNRTLKVITIIILIVSAIVSWGPCWLVKAWSIGVGGAEESYCSHMAVLFTIITLVEIIFLINSGGKGLRILGVILQLIKLFLPVFWYSVSAGMLNQGIMASSRNYYMTKLGYSLYIFTAVVVILYIVLFVLEIISSKKKESELWLPWEEGSDKRFQEEVADTEDTEKTESVFYKVE